MTQEIPLKPSEVLDNAANIILRDGWHASDYYKAPLDCTPEEDRELAKTAPCCQAGAIVRATTGSAWSAGPTPPEVAALQAGADEYMRKYILRVHGVRRPIAWNDQAGRTKEEVVAALRGAAEDARRAGE